MNPHDVRRRLCGAMTVLVTPFSRGEPDLAALSALADWQIREGAAALVPGTLTGEAPTLLVAEQLAVIQRCVEAAQGRVPVVAGTGSNSTAATIALTLAAQARGADAALVVLPYYSKPSAEGVCRHVAAVAAATSLPLIVHTVPARTGIDLKPAILQRLAALPTVIGIADGTGDLSGPPALRAAFGNRFLHLSAHDPTALGFLLSGGDGTLSQVANVAPGLCAGMHRAAIAGDHHTAVGLEDRLSPLSAALDPDGDPVGVKHALQLRHGILAEVRLPLLPASTQRAADLAAALRSL